MMNVSVARRWFSGFRPRRRPNPNYRPVKPRKNKKPGPRDPYTMEPLGVVELGNYDSKDPLERDFGPMGAAAIRYMERKDEEYSVEDQLSLADYITSEPGTTEELQGERRALAMEGMDEAEREAFLKEVDEILEEERIKGLGLGHLEFDKEVIKDDDDDDDLEEEVDENGEPIDPTQLVHGEWQDMVIRVDGVQKVQRGGTMLRYRALVIGGNGNGCAGFGIAKAASPIEATNAASRMCKRNVFFVDRYMGGITRDLVGKHNSCRVFLRAVDPHRGLKGHPLACEILAFFGIADCTAKSHGNRNQFNVVRATFKALMTHESLEELALKRGKRLINVERAKRLQI